MRDFVRLPYRFEADRLVRDLDRVPDHAWVDHFNREDYDGGWSVVALYSPTGSEGFIFSMHSDQFELHETPLLDDCSYFREVAETFRGRKHAVRLLNLRAGARILEHCDPDLSFAAGLVRLHVPIVTNPGVECYIRGHRLVMRPGECWYADFSLPHRVENNSSEDRVHLVIDCCIDDELRSVFAGLGFSSSID